MKVRFSTSAIFNNFIITPHGKGIMIRIRLPLKKIIIWLVLLFVVYHVVFGGLRMFADRQYNNRRYGNVVITFGEQLRTAVFYDEKEPLIWKLIDVRTEDLQNPIVLDSNIYSIQKITDYFYRDSTLYALGQNGFWIIDAEPFHISLLRNDKLPPGESEKLDEIIRTYNMNGNQFYVFPRKEYVKWWDRIHYDDMQKKAQLRIKKLKGKGLYPNFGNLDITFEG